MDILRYFSVFIFYNIILLFSLLCMIKFRMTLVRFEWYWRRQSNCSEQECWSVHTTLWIGFSFLIFLVKRMEPLRIFTILACYFVLIQGKTHFLKNVYHHIKTLITTIARIAKFAWQYPSAASCRRGWRCANHLCCPQSGIQHAPLEEGRYGKANPANLDSWRKSCYFRFSIQRIARFRYPFILKIISHKFK